MNRPFATVLLTVAAIAASAVAQTREVVDAYGRTVDVPDKIERIVCTGSGALRLVSYLGAIDRLAGVEASDKKYEKDSRRDYAFANHDHLRDLPVIGKGGDTVYTAYPEALIETKPDVILSDYAPEALERLARETSISVVSVRYLSINFIDENFGKALCLAAEILGKEDRAKEIVDFVDAAKKDLARRADSDDSELKRVYAGAVTFSSAHGFSGTYSNFGPFAAIKVPSIADRPDREGFYEISLESVLEADPQAIFLDPSNLGTVKDEYTRRKDFFDLLSAVKEKAVYTMPSFNNYSNNVAYALIDAYRAGIVLRPAAFADVDLKTKAEEILMKFMARTFFDEMQAYGERYGEVSLDE